MKKVDKMDWHFLDARAHYSLDPNDQTDIFTEYIDVGFLRRVGLKGADVFIPKDQHERKHR